MQDAQPPTAATQRRHPPACAAAHHRLDGGLAPPPNLQLRVPHAPQLRGGAVLPGLVSVPDISVDHSRLHLQHLGPQGSSHLPRPDPSHGCARRGATGKTAHKVRRGFCSVGLILGESDGAPSNRDAPMILALGVETDMMIRIPRLARR